MASVRDNAKSIIRLTEERTLEIDFQICQKARADLTNPRSRLGAELAWLPGVAPSRAADLIKKLEADPIGIRNETGLPVLPYLNLLSAAIEATSSEIDPIGLANLTIHFSIMAEKLDAEHILRDINEDRMVGGYPEVQSEKQIETELDERRRHYISVLTQSLNNQKANSLVETMTKIVEGSTMNGTQPPLRMIDLLVDRYEIECQSFLEREAENLRQLLIEIRQSASNEKGELINSLIDKVGIVSKNRDRVAKPIQMNAKAKGISHEPSRNLAYEIRSVAIDLFNENNLLEQSKILTSLLQQFFDELPDVYERLEQDSEALENIFEERKNAEKSQAEWAETITYRAEIGMVFKDTLSISPAGVSWKGRNYTLDSITRVRWGGLSKSVNGIPTGTNYTIAFGDERTEAVVELRSEQVFSNFVDRLWKAVGVRLMFEMLQALQSGMEFKLGGGGVLRDDGVTLVKHKFLSKSEVSCGWHQVKVWSASGNFYIGANDDKSTYISLPYIEAANAHVIEQGIRIFFKNNNATRMSDLLK